MPPPCRVQIACELRERAAPDPGLVQAVEDLERRLPVGWSGAEGGGSGEEEAPAHPGVDGCVVLRLSSDSRTEDLRLEDAAATADGALWALCDALRSALLSDQPRRVEWTEVTLRAAGGRLRVAGGASEYEADLAEFAADLFAAAWRFCGGIRERKIRGSVRFADAIAKVESSVMPLVRRRCGGAPETV
jgi:hypothetical protein